MFVFKGYQREKLRLRTTSLVNHVPRPMPHVRQRRSIKSQPRRIIKVGSERKQLEELNTENVAIDSYF